MIDDNTMDESFEEMEAVFIVLFFCVVNVSEG